MPYAFNKPDAKEAWKEAFPSMPAAARDGIVNKCGEARKWLGRKWRNMKTGEKKHRMVKELMASLFKEETTPKRNIYKEPAKGSSPSAKPSEAKAKQLPGGMTIASNGRGQGTMTSGSGGILITASNGAALLLTTASNGRGGTGGIIIAMPQTTNGSQGIPSTGIMSLER